MDAISEGNVGFVSIVGRPNVGKSTFINKALGYHLTAVSTRPNTTRKKWRGILSDDDSQIVFVDTPGMHASSNKMQEAMAGSIASSIKDNDVALCVCDPTRSFGEEDKLVATALASSGKPIVLALNKVDLASREEIDAIRDSYLEIILEPMVFEISALKGTGIDELLSCIKGLMPEGPFLYPKESLTDVIERDIAEEVIREAANERVYQEIPQSLLVKIDDWNENEKKVKIAATLYIERATQKQIVIGAKGAMINSIAKAAREKLREDVGKFVDVKLRVKVSADWQNKQRFLRDMSVVD